MAVKSTGQKEGKGYGRSSADAKAVGKGIKGNAPVLPPIGYRLVLADRSESGLGTPILSDVFSTTGTPDVDYPLVYSEALNAEGSLEFTVPTDHAAVTRANFAIGEREIHLYRDSGAGEQLIWGGRLLLDDVQGNYVRFIAYGWYWDLSRREVDTDFAMLKTDQFVIVRQLIDDTQALLGGDLGLTHYDPSAMSGTPRTIIACLEERRLISDIIEDLASARASFDFAITPDKKFRMWRDRRGVSRPITLDGLGNLGELSYQEDATEIASMVTVVGPQRECHRPVVQREPSGPNADYSARDKYGLLMESVNLEHNHDDDFRTAIALETLRVAQAPQFSATVVIPSGIPGAPDLTTYEVGDSLRVKTTRGATGGFGYIDEALRLVERRVACGRIGRESVTGSLVREVEV